MEPQALFSQRLLLGRKKISDLKYVYLCLPPHIICDENMIFWIKAVDEVTFEKVGLGPIRELKQYKRENSFAELIYKVS